MQKIGKNDSLSKIKGVFHIPLYPFLKSYIPSKRKVKIRFLFLFSNIKKNWKNEIWLAFFINKKVLFINIKFLIILL